MRQGGSPTRALHQPLSCKSRSLDRAAPARLDNRSRRAGVTAGGGVEVALGARWSIKGEYLYYNFGNWSYDLTQNTVTSVPAPGTTAPFFTTGITATTRNFNGSRWA